MSGLELIAAALAAVACGVAGWRYCRAADRVFGLVERTCGALVPARAVER